jgi:hypothetical protein
MDPRSGLRPEAALPAMRHMVPIGPPIDQVLEASPGWPSAKLGPGLIGPPIDQVLEASPGWPPAQLGPGLIGPPIDRRHDRLRAELVVDGSVRRSVQAR